jgi:hypothetical protein
MIVARAAALCVLALAAGCGDTSVRNQQAGGNDQEPRIRIANKHHDDLTQLRPGLQRIAMMRAIRSSGNRCQLVDNAGYQEEYRNMRMWVARCPEEDKTFSVYIAANGDVQVRDCADAGTLSLPRCNPLPPPVPDERESFKEGAADKAFRNQF